MSKKLTENFDQGATPLRILIISDAWQPQINGVVRTYENLSHHLNAAGHAVQVVGPRDFRHVPLPFYNEIDLAIFPRRKLEKMIKDFNPDHIHIAVEGPLGRAAQKICHKNGYDYTTCYHSHFPDYIAKRCMWMGNKIATVIRNIVISDLRKFHARARTVFVATQSLEDTLRSWGFKAPMTRLLRGVDTTVFHPPLPDAPNATLDRPAPARIEPAASSRASTLQPDAPHPDAPQTIAPQADVAVPVSHAHPTPPSVASATSASATVPSLAPRPVLLYVGRVATEKNIRAFLDLDIDADKIVVGGGPELETLKKAYPAVEFAGYQTGAALGDYYRKADLFVFPSKTDTFGMVLIEALACGTPIAGYDVTGPRDIVDRPLLGAVSHDLHDAVTTALRERNNFTRADRFAFIRENYTWPAVAAVFAGGIGHKKTQPARP